MRTDRPAGSRLLCSSGQLRGHTLDDHSVSQSDNECVHGPCTNFTKLVGLLDIRKAFAFHFPFHLIYTAAYLGCKLM